MNAFTLKNGQLHAESVALPEIAERFGTPCYVYSRAALEAALDEYLHELEGVDSLVCYAVKANASLALLNAPSALSTSAWVISATTSGVR